MSSDQHIPAFPVYLFDVDGTLLDSAGDICGSIQDALRAYGGAAVDDQFLRSHIGWNLMETFLKLGYPEEVIESMIETYRTSYRTRNHSATSMFPGVPQMLSRLGGRKSTATTKGTTTTRTVLEKFGIDRHFDHVQGTDGFPAKPHPDVILKCFEALGVGPSECLLVGDSSADMEAGRRAGVKICAVRYGYGVPAEMARWEPDYWIDNPQDLICD